MKKACFFGLLITMIAISLSGFGCSKNLIVVGKVCAVEKEATIECDPPKRHRARVMSIVFEDRPAIHTKRENFYPDMLKFVGKRTEIVVCRSWYGGLGRKDYYQEIISIKEVEVSLF